MRTLIIQLPMGEPGAATAYPHAWVPADAAPAPLKLQWASASLLPASDRLRVLAHTLSTEAPEIDFMKHAFNTPALLGEMGAGPRFQGCAIQCPGFQVR